MTDLPHSKGLSATSATALASPPATESDYPEEPIHSPEALQIAMWIRLYRLLGNRPELRRSDLAERIDVVSDEEHPLGFLDRNLVQGADELDRLCGYAVGMLRRGGSIKAILDLLGTFEPERLLAIYFALPEDRRKIVRRGDGVWAYRIERAPEGIEEAGFFLEDMNVTDPEPVPQELADFRRERRRFLAGLPHELSPNEMAMGLRV